MFQRLFHSSWEELTTLNKSFHTQSLNIGLDESVLTRNFKWNLIWQHRNVAFNSFGQNQSKSDLLLRSEKSLPSELALYWAGTKPGSKWTCLSFSAPSRQIDEDRMSRIDKYPSPALRLSTSHTFMLCPTIHWQYGGSWTEIEQYSLSHNVGCQKRKKDAKVIWLSKSKQFKLLKPFVILPPLTVIEWIKRSRVPT